MSAIAFAVITAKDDHIYPWTCSDDSEVSKAHFVDPQIEIKDWEGAVHAGYDCVPVELTVVASEKQADR